jgi:hypothetical protein
VRSTTKNDFRRYVQLHKILFVKKKNTAHAAQAKDFVGVKRRQNESGVLRGGKNLHREQILATLYFSTKLAGFAIKGITVCKVRQDGFAKFIVIKR